MEQPFVRLFEFVAPGRSLGPTPARIAASRSSIERPGFGVVVEWIGPGGDDGHRLGKALAP